VLTDLPFCIAAIDPGLTGAVAVYFPHEPNRITVEDMPVCNGETDATTLARHLEDFRPNLLVIEVQHAMPKQGLSSTFRTGDNYGAVRGVVAALKIETHFVRARDWQRHFKIAKADKEVSRSIALRLFTLAPFYFQRKKDHGRAEAALMARYAAETLNWRIAA